MKTTSLLITRFLIIMLVFYVSHLKIPADSSAAELGFEAENADELVPDMAAFEDKEASGGKFIAAGLGNGGRHLGYAEYEIDIPQAGEYSMWGRVLTTGGGNDSFHVTIDDLKSPQAADQDKIWDTGNPIPAWGWSKVKWREENPLTFNLTRGKHVLRIWSREGNTRLDAIYMSTDANAAPRLPDEVEPFALESKGKLTTTWAAIKKQ